MKYNWVDIGLAILILISFFRGYKAGFLKSIFSLVGYVGGGVLGLAINFMLRKELDTLVEGAMKAATQACFFKKRLKIKH